ncbi:MAG TPA: hypothetical protein VJ752_15100 [Burkholderiaceae bacterium]|nr:hypothetical protein [Burkholderiaceae bacterium]
MNIAILDLANEALAQISPMAEAGWAPAQSIERQLRWCVGFASDQATEPRPGPFTMGLIATRELDMYGDQPELASLINQVQKEIERVLG